MTKLKSEEPNVWVEGAAALVRRAVPTPLHVPPLRFTGARRRTPLLAFGFASLAACALTLVLTQQNKSLTYEVVSGIRMPADEPTIVGGSESALLRFSDGTTAALEPGAQARVRGLHPQGARMAIDKGRADFDVIHREKTAWVVEAGPYTVRVTGTRFRVAWDPASTVFDLQMRSGTVEVVGPYIKNTAVVSSGQSLRFRVSDGAGEMQPQAPPVPAPPAEGPAHDEPVPIRPIPVSQPKATLARLTARGDYQAVVDHATKVGVAVLLKRQPATELVALAEAARYTHNVALANQVLKAIRARWPHSPAAADAAFILGTLAEDVNHDGATANRWYRTYLQEAGRGRYASETLGRSLVLTQQLEGNEAAKPKAQRYVKQFPTGTYAGVAHRILNAP